MANGYSIHIGLNGVDPKHYAGWSGKLNACEADARDMAAIAAARGFKAQTVLTGNATRKAVTAALNAAAKAMRAGDLLLLSYSGHGGQLPDQDSDEPDGMDETWCLYDGEVSDDELYALYRKFAPGTRIVVFSDSCHSGTVAREAWVALQARLLAKTTEVRAMPREVALSTYLQNQALYDGIAKATPSAAADDAQAAILLLSGCQDNQTSLDGMFNGLFTATLKRVWKASAFKGDYRAFHRAIVQLMPPDQTPNLCTAGAADPALLAKTPFTV